MVSLVSLRVVSLVEPVAESSAVKSAAEVEVGLNAVASVAAVAAWRGFIFALAIVNDSDVRDYGELTVCQERGQRGPH